MCGIAGILNLGEGPPPEPARLRAMVAMLRHRGPDGIGFYLDRHCALGHARLSIIDLAGGAQPMANEDRSLWISFNGEIFNDPELRRQLEPLGHRFATSSDTEAILHGFEQWGDGVWDRLEGQFAVALWDSRARVLRLARDRAGIAPLFYTRRRGSDGIERLWLASEIKAIAAANQGQIGPGHASASPGLGLDPVGLASAFTLWSCPGPGTTHAGVRTVCPGEVVTFHASRHAAESRAMYAQPPFMPAPDAPERIEDAADSLEAALRESVRVRLRADVPVGCYVSGGLDSSIIARLAREAHSGTLHTFSLRFQDPAFDETSAQRRLASSLGTEHHEILVGPDDLQRCLADVVWHAETPLLRTGPAPMFLLSALVRQTGMKVVLTGEGADELLGGYDVFKEAKVRRFWARDPGADWRAALLARVHPYIASAAQQGGMWREYFRRGIHNVADPCFSHTPRWETTAWSLRFLSPEVRSAAASLNPSAMVSALMGPEPAGTTALARSQRIEWSTFMGSYLLSSQGDRMALGHGVEARFPFLDSRVIKLAGGLRDRHKLCGLREKVALRAVALRILPAEVRARRKWPYRAPIASALFGPHAPQWVREAMSPEALSACPWIDAKPAAALAARFLGPTATPGARAGEREEMALIGLLSLVLLDRQSGSEFIGRAAACLRANEHVTPDVLVDRRKEPPHG